MFVTSVTGSNACSKNVTERILLNGVLLSILAIAHVLGYHK